MRAGSLFDDPASARTAKSLDRKVLALFHPGLVSVLVFVADDWD